MEGGKVSLLSPSLARILSEFAFSFPRKTAVMQAHHFVTALNVCFLSKTKSCVTVTTRIMYAIFEKLKLGFHLPHELFKFHS